MLKKKKKTSASGQQNRPSRCRGQKKRFLPPFVSVFTRFLLLSPHLPPNQLSPPRARQVHPAPCCVHGLTRVACSSSPPPLLPETLPAQLRASSQPRRQSQVPGCERQSSPCRGWGGGAAGGLTRRTWRRSRCGETSATLPFLGSLPPPNHRRAPCPTRIVLRTVVSLLSQPHLSPSDSALERGALM